MTSTITAHSSTELLSLIPYLVGHHISEGAVALLCEGRRVHLTLRFPTNVLDDPDPVLHHFEATLEAMRHPRVFLAGFGPAEQAHALLDLLEPRVESSRLIDSVITNGERWWSRRCEVCCTDEGMACDPASPAAVAAIVQGATALESRDQMLELIAGPPLVEQPALLARLIETSDLVSQLDPADRPRRMQHLVADVLGTRLHVDEAIELVALAAEVPARDAAWESMDLENAEHHLELWRQVLDHAPRSHAVPVLCLAASAAWLSGNGALMGCCLERGLGIDPDHSMLQLLAQVHQRSLAPTLWQRMKQSWSGR